MGQNKKHRDIVPSDGVHTPFAAIYPNEAARLAATGFTLDDGVRTLTVPFSSIDIGKIVRVTDVQKIYILENHYPITWGDFERENIPDGGIDQAKLNLPSLLKFLKKIIIGHYLTSNDESNSTNAGTLIIYAGASPLPDTDPPGGTKSLAITKIRISEVAYDGDPSDPNSNPISPAVDWSIVLAGASIIVNVGTGVICPIFRISSIQRVNVTGPVTMNNTSYYEVIVRPVVYDYSFLHSTFIARSFEVFIVPNTSVVNITNLIGMKGPNRFMRTDASGGIYNAPLTEGLNTAPTEEDTLVLKKTSDGREYFETATVEKIGDAIIPAGDRPKGVSTVWYSIQRKYVAFVQDNDDKEISIDTETSASETIVDRDGNSFDKADMLFILIETGEVSEGEKEYILNGTKIGSMFTVIRGDRWLTGLITHVFEDSQGPVKIYYTTVATLSHGENNRSNAPYVGYTTDAGGDSITVNFDAPGVSAANVYPPGGLVIGETSQAPSGSVAKVGDDLKVWPIADMRAHILGPDSKELAIGNFEVSSVLPTTAGKVFSYTSGDLYGFNITWSTTQQETHLESFLSDGERIMVGDWLAEVSGVVNKNTVAYGGFGMFLKTLSGTPPSSGSVQLSIIGRVMHYDDANLARFIRDLILSDWDYLQIFDQEQASAESDYSVVPISIAAAGGNGNRLVTTGKIDLDFVSKISVPTDSDSNPVQLNPDALFQVVGTGKIYIPVSVPTALVCWVGIQYSHIGSVTIAGTKTEYDAPSTHWERYNLHTVGGDNLIEANLSELTSDVSLMAFNIVNSVLQGNKSTHGRYRLLLRFYPVGSAPFPKRGTKNNIGIADTTVAEVDNTNTNILYTGGTVTIKPITLVGCRITHKQR